MPQARKGQPKTASAERQYAKQLRKVARHVGDIISAFPPGDPAVDGTISAILRQYSDTINGWAIETATIMLRQVEKAEAAVWFERSVQMGDELRRVIQRTPIGDLLATRLAEQVVLIKSLPTEAAQRVHNWTLVGIEDSSRSTDMIDAIQRSGPVTANRAKLIARTEVARTASLLTETRARAVGSKGYIWRTSRDSDVRDSHAKMEGQYVEWDNPPTLSDGTTTHAGQIYNCRCYPEVVVPPIPAAGL